MTRSRSPALIHVALLLTAIIAAGPARGAQFIFLEDECNGRQLMIQGVIEPGDYQRFVERLAHLVAGGDLPEVQNPDVLWTVKLDSPGGDPGEAMQIGRLLRHALATTEVSYRYARRPDGVYDFARSGELVCLSGEDRLSGCHQDIVEAECTGACLLVWLGGAERHANEGRLGLHGTLPEQSPDRESSGSSQADGLETYLADMGVSESWTTRLVAGSATGDGWLSWAERHELSGRADALQTLIAGCPAPLTRDESYRSVTAPSAAERDRLMDRADAHRRCRRDLLVAERIPTLSRLSRTTSLSRTDHETSATESGR